MRAELVKKRVVVSEDVDIPIELSTFNRSRSFPLCGDILRRFVSANPEIELGQSLRTEMAKIKLHQRSLSVLKSLDDVIGDERLYPYQRVGVAWLLTIKRGILADDQGLGKTVMAAVACDQVGNDNIGVICTSTNMSGWKDHMERYCPSHDIYIVNYEGIYELPLELDVLIIDEAHKLRNRNTLWFKRARVKARRPEYVFLLTATPTINADQDLWTLLNLCDPDRFSSYWSYIFRFFDVVNTRFGMKIEGVKESEKENLERMVSQYILHRDESIKELPEISKKQINYKMVGEHKRIYRQMEKDWVAELLKERISADVKIAQITRLRQLAISPRILFPDYRAGDKIDEILEVLGKDPETSVIFTSFEEAAWLVEDRLRGYGIESRIISGKVSSAKRDKAQEGFGKDFNVLILTHGTGGESINLPQATQVIFLDLAWHPAGNRHAMKRVHRIGQEHEVKVIVIHAANTVEEWKDDVIRSKGRMATADLIRRMTHGD